MPGPEAPGGGGGEQRGQVAGGGRQGPTRARRGGGGEGGRRKRGRGGGGRGREAGRQHVTREEQGRQELMKLVSTLLPIHSELQTKK